jgi:hypothetical protein
MIDQQQLQPGQVTTEDTAASPQKPSQTLMDSLLALQALQVKLAHSFLRNWMEMLMLPWGRPAQQQQATFQRLMTTPMQPHLDVLLAPLTLSRKLVEASMTATQRERELVEARETVMHQERELAQEASR